MGSPEVRIALASQGGTRVDRHFGRTSQFLVYRWESGAFVAEAPLVLEPVCGEESGHEQAGALDPFAAFQLVVAAAAGPPMIRALLERGVRFVVFEGPVDEVLAKLPETSLYRNLFPKSPLKEEKNG